MNLDREKVRRVFDLWKHWRRYFPRLARRPAGAAERAGKIKEAIAAKLGLTAGLVDFILKCNWPF